MYLYGTFYNQKGEPVELRILTDGDNTDSREIGTDEADIYFSDESPIEITGEMTDTFDVLLQHSATIRLQCGQYVPELYCQTCRQAVVNIWRGGELLFCGYVEPHSYSQDYIERWDDVELSCIDALSALQYSNYAGIGQAAVSYAIVKAEARQRTFWDIISEILQGAADGLLISEDGTATTPTLALYYDGSKAIDSDTANRYTLLGQLTISELLFLGDEEDDVWTQQTVIEEMLRYLGLHLQQEGTTLRLFSWETIRATTATTWRNLMDTTQVETPTPRTIDIDLSTTDGTDTSITIPETYNQLQLTCDIQEQENIVESPLDSDSLTSFLGGRCKYMTELEYNKNTNNSTVDTTLCAVQFLKMMAHYTDPTQENTTDGDAIIRDWYVELKRNPKWTFPCDTEGTDLYSDPSLYADDANYIPKILSLGGQDPRHRRITGCLLSTGSLQQAQSKTSDKPTSKIGMTDQLVISVNGNGLDGETTYQPDTDTIKACIPVATYIGPSAGGNFSPADKDVTNYIIVSGKLCLNPLMDVPYTYNEWLDSTVTKKYDKMSAPYRSGYRLYTQQYWKSKDVGNAATPENDPQNWRGWCPFTDEGPQYYKFKYSSVGDSTDQISKVAVLACMLVIGKKVCVEKTPTDDLGTGIAYTGKGKPEDFVWMDYKTRDECQSDDEYYLQCFYIGFNPDIDDYIIGQEYDIQLNYDYTYGIDGDEGTAIPIHRDDLVSGQVTFQILGPVNATWDEVTRRHPTFFRHTKWGTNTIPLMAHTSSIIIKEFEVTVASDNGGLSTDDTDNDIVYISDTDEKFINKKDDLEFKISSALTLEECQELGVATTVNLSTPISAKTEGGLLTFYDVAKAQQVKPEQDYVDSYYEEYHQPHVVIEQTLRDSVASEMSDAQNGIISPLYHYRHPAMGRTFHVESISRNLMAGTATVKMKEIKES